MCVTGSGYDSPLQVSLIALIVFALGLSLFTNVNQTGLHRFYRDRLMEAFMPLDSAVASGTTASSPEADHFHLHDAWDQALPDPRAAGIEEIYRGLPVANEIGPAHLPYPIINANVILINDDEKKVAARGGDNYMLSPIYCGSSATGWVRTIHPICRNLTVASAMAASGAAANSNSGYVGGGLTRNTLISVAMMFLNIRLGYWMPNPNGHNQRRSLRWRNPTHWYPGFWYAVLSKGYKRDSGFLELSDGGHFENLGLYELIRRHCRVILIADGEEDKQTAYLALVSAVRRIEEDFGATIEFAPGKGPERLVASLDMGYPSGAKQSAFPYLVAKINYGDGASGVILYLKSAITGAASFKLKGYKGANPDFPNETTADQFFDAVQFESYRELGYLGARTMIANLGLDGQTICNWSSIWSAARRRNA
jgi:hypothetical protein